MACMPCTGAADPVFQLSFMVTTVLVSSGAMLEIRELKYVSNASVPLPFRSSARLSANDCQVVTGLYGAGNIPFATIPSLVTAPWLELSR